eukprot:m.175482 g.175482  ORF g.175482 m.175482 type:complete len:689 (+) comp18355_c0_seq2:116-2182(+)
MQPNIPLVPDHCWTFQIFVECGVLRYAGWRCIMRCRQLGSQWNSALVSEHWWKAVCLDFAEEYGLYIQQASPDWKWSATFEHLWKYRFKFDPLKMPSLDFNITVTARFRPGATATRRSDFFLPLHQRLKLRKPGELLTFKDAENGLDDSAITSIAGGSATALPPELVRALLDAARLGHAASRAETDGASASALWTSDVANNLGDDADGNGSGKRARVANGDGDVAAEGHDMHPPADNAADNRRRQGAAADQPRAARHAAHLARQRRHEGAARRGGQARVVSVDPSRVCMYVPGQGVRKFMFEHVFKDSAAQHTVYARVARPVVTSFLHGVDSCLLAYGQTGSGKTYTVFGPSSVVDSDAATADDPGPGPEKHPEHLPAAAGMVLRAVCEALQARRTMATRGVRCHLAVKYVQIYQERITDLCTNRPADLRTTAGGDFELAGCSEHAVDTMADVLELLRVGEKNKVFAATMMNDHSSRAHTVFILSATQVKVTAGASLGGSGGLAAEGSSTSQTTAPLVSSRLYLVDLAGCEQLKQSQATGRHREEAVGINYSLMVLKKVIRALVECKAHVPYRESTLTQLLKSSLGGSARTSAIITGAPEDEFAAQTLHAMRFGEAIAQVTNTISADAMSEMSIDDALKFLHEALSNSRRTLASLAANGRHHLPAYAQAQRMEQDLARHAHVLESLQS